MLELSEIISTNLKKLRSEKKLSLDKVAKMTGVSKSMLGQIERGEANPTVTTVWKIANGLKVSFTALMKRSQSDIEIINKTDLSPLLEDDGKFRNYPIFPFDEQRRFEIYTIEIDSGGYLNAEAHPQGTQEFITIFSGELTIKVKEEEYLISDGGSIHFSADAPHAYYNSGKDIIRFSMVIYYPE